MAMADIAINIVTKGAELAKRQLQGIGNQGDKSSKGLGRFSTAVKVAGVALAVGLAKGLSKAVTEFIAFDDKMVQSLAIMDTTVEQQKAMQNAALETSRTTRIGAEQSAEAYFFLASAGLNAEQSISALPQVAKFAQAGMFDMATATDLATDAQSALGLTVSNAQENLANLTRVTDVLVKANTLANASVQQFSEALTTKAGAALKVVNKDIEEGVAVLAAFADRGVKGAEAGDKLNQVLRDIPRATAKNSEEFAKLGLNMFDTEGNMKNVADIVEELDAVLGPMSDELKASTLDQLGLNRGVADAVKILSGASGQIRQYEADLRNAGGTTDDVANKQMGSLKAQLDLMNNAFSELGIVIGQIIGPAITSIVKGITKLTQGFTKAITVTDEFFESAKNVNGAIDNQIYGVEQVTKSYDKYSQAVYEAKNTTVDNRTATQKAIDAQKGLERANRFSVPSYMDVTDASIAKAQAHRDEIKEQENLIKVEAERINNIHKNALSAFDKLSRAQQNLSDIYQEQEDLLKDRNKASQSVEKAEKKLANANDIVTQAQHELKDAMEKAKEVTLEEELAILKQTEAVKELEEAENKNKIQEIELALAKERLTELILESTGATQDQLSAQRDLATALTEQKRAEDEVINAQERLTEATKEYNEVTAKTPENILRIALAKEELDKAMADARSLGTFEELLTAMVDRTGIQLDRLRNQFSNLYNGTTPSTATGGGGGAGGGSDKFGTDGTITPETVIPDKVVTPISAMDKIGANAGVTTIIHLQQENNIQNNDPDAVAMAILEAQRRGIKVIL